MRTTWTIEDGTYRHLQREIRRRSCSFREVVNESLRRGLDQLNRPGNDGPYRLDPHKGGPKPGISLERIQELLDEVEGRGRR